MHIRVVPLYFFCMVDALRYQYLNIYAVFLPRKSFAAGRCIPFLVLTAAMRQGGKVAVMGKGGKAAVIGKGGKLAVTGIGGKVAREVETIPLIHNETGSALDGSLFF